MKFRDAFIFDYPASVILRMFADRDYYQAKYEKMGVVPEVLDTQVGSKRFTITVRHALDAGRLSLPDFIKHRIGDHLHMRQTDAWQLDRGEGRIILEIEKLPVRLDAKLHLANQLGGSRLTFDFDVRASVPLLGPRIEKAVAGPVTRHILKEMTLSQEMAADYAQEGTP